MLRACVGSGESTFLEIVRKGEKGEYFLEIIRKAGRRGERGYPQITTLPYELRAARG